MVFVYKHIYAENTKTLYEEIYKYTESKTRHLKQTK